MMLKALSDPFAVAKFQQLCGLREIRPEENDFQPVRNSKDTISTSRNERVSAVNGFSNNDCTKSTNFVHRNGSVAAESIEKLRLVEGKRGGQPYECNSFFHLLFQFGSWLGYELFYLTFFSFVSWNVDEYLARRTATMWVVIMYIGQASKDLIQWPRPECPPVIPVEKRFKDEYGMPSTHAMVGTLMPVCLVYFTYGRYQVCTCCLVIYLCICEVFDCLIWEVF